VLFSSDLLGDDHTVFQDELGNGVDDNGRQHFPKGTPIAQSQLC